jgi:hypothetical protein
MPKDDMSEGWDTWSKHVLKELKRLNIGQETISKEIHSIKSNMVKFPVIENHIAEVKNWKKDVTEVASPTQLKELVDKVDDLEKFKIKAIAVFTFIQLMFGLAMGVSKLIA